MGLTTPACEDYLDRTGEINLCQLTTDKVMLWSDQGVSGNTRQHDHPMQPRRNP